MASKLPPNPVSGFSDWLKHNDFPKPKVKNGPPIIIKGKPKKLVRKGRNPVR